jgi:transcriptional regulator with GAF, ATPase, and Fis domain
MLLPEKKNSPGSNNVSTAPVSPESEIQRFEPLLELAAILSRQTDFDEVLRVITQKAAFLLEAEAAVIMMINPQTRQTIKTIFKEGEREDELKYQPVHKHVSGWVIKNGKPFMSADLKNDARFTKNYFENVPIQAVLAAPLVVEGVIIGTILVIHPGRADTALAQELAYLENLANIVAPYLRNLQKVQAYFETRFPQSALLSKYEALGLLGKSKKFVDMLQAVEAAAHTGVRVLLQGQSGTGKELIARAIHHFSARSDKSFVAVDCGAIPANLIESELFGHVKGAFTGATSDRKGLFDEANGGTLFMDEITNLPLEMQAKLMRVLQEGEIRPLGSNKTRQVDVRVISASSGSLRKLVDKQQFREDLFYRLHVYPINVPSLHERQEDIPLLANHFLKKFSEKQGKQTESFHEEILDYMQEQLWPGNIRELENFVERLVTNASPTDKTLGREILPPELRKKVRQATPSDTAFVINKSLLEHLAKVEEQLIRQALVTNNWNQSQAARALKIPEQTLRYKMGKLGIAKPNSGSLE